MHDVLLQSMFLAQTMQAGGNGAVGIISFLAMIASVGGISFGAWQIAHQNMMGLVPIIISALVAAYAVPIVNSSFHIVGNSGMTLTATNPD